MWWGRRSPVRPRPCTARRWVSARQRPTDVIVVSSKSSTVSNGSFQQFVAPAGGYRPDGSSVWLIFRPGRPERSR